MNRSLISFAVALALVFVAVSSEDGVTVTVDNSDSAADTVSDIATTDIVSDSTTDLDETNVSSLDSTVHSTTNSDNCVNDFVNSTLSVSDKSRLIEDKLNDALGDMMSGITKSLIDMSNIVEDMKNIGQYKSTDHITNNLVKNLVSYVGNDAYTKEKIGEVMKLKSELQQLLLKQLNTLPIDEEDAKKMESDLREQLKLKYGKVPSPSGPGFGIPQGPEFEIHRDPEFIFRDGLRFGIPQGPYHMPQNPRFSMPQEPGFPRPTF